MGYSANWDQIFVGSFVRYYYAMTTNMEIP